MGVMNTGWTGIHSFDLSTIDNATNRPKLSTQGSNQSSNPSFKCNLSGSPSPQKRYQINEALEHIGFGTYQLRILVVTGSLLASNAAEIVVLSFLLRILKDEWNLKQDINSIIGAMVFFGMLIGTILWRYVSEKYGSVRVLQICILGQIIFGACCGLCQDIYSIAVLKLFHGLFLGGTMVGFKLYSDCCPIQNKNKLFRKQLNFWVIGIVANTSIAWIILETLNWRWYLIISELCLSIVFMFSFCISECPQWLMIHRHINEAQIVLIKAARLNRHHLPKGSLKKSSNVFNLRSNDWKRIFSAKYYTMSITLYIIAWCCMFGYFGMILLSVRFFDEFYSDEAFYLKIFIVTCAEIPCLLMVSRIGTKSPLMVSFIIFAICMITLSLRIDMDVAIVAVVVLFIARMCICFAFLKIYVVIHGFYGNVSSNTAAELVYILGIFSAIVTVVVSQSNDPVWAWYIYALSGVASFVATCTLKMGTIYSKSQIMKSVDEKKKKSMDQSCQKIEENSVEIH